MISLNSGSTYLQNQIISGFDSVAQGLTATTSAGSSTGIQAAMDSFSSFEASEMTELSGLGSQQQISGAAEFSSPTTYMNNQLFDSAIRADDPVLSAFKDPQLGAGGELSSISEIVSKIASQAEQQGIIIVSGSPTELLQQGGSTRLEQAGLMTPPQYGGTTDLEQVGLMTPPQYGGGFDVLAQQGSTRLQQVGLMTPPQIGGSTELELTGLMTPPQYGGGFDAIAQQGSTRLEQAGLMTPPQIGGSTKLEQAGLMTPPQYGGIDGSQEGIVFSSQHAATLTSMSKTVRSAANLFQDVNASMLSRRIMA